MTRVESHAVSHLLCAFQLQHFSSATLLRFAVRDAFDELLSALAARSVRLAARVGESAVDRLRSREHVRQLVAEAVTDVFAVLLAADTCVAPARQQVLQDGGVFRIRVVEYLHDRHLAVRTEACV